MSNTIAEQNLEKLQLEQDYLYDQHKEQLPEDKSLAEKTLPRKLFNMLGKA